MGSELKLQVKYHKPWFWSEYNQHRAGEAVMHNDLLQEVVILYNCLHDRQETWFWLKKFNGRRAHVHLMYSRKQNDSLINSAEENPFLKLKICGQLPVYLSFFCIYINSLVFHIMRDTKWLWIIKGDTRCFSPMKGPKVGCSTNNSLWNFILKSRGT